MVVGVEQLAGGLDRLQAARPQNFRQLPMDHFHSLVESLGNRRGALSSRLVRSRQEPAATRRIKSRWRSAETLLFPVECACGNCRTPPACAANDRRGPRSPLFSFSIAPALQPSSRTSLLLCLRLQAQYSPSNHLCWISLESFGQGCGELFFFVLHNPSILYPLSVGVLMLLFN